MATAGALADRGPPRPGETGDRVALLQQRLGLAADGVLGPATQSALDAFRQSRGLREYEAVDSALWRLLAIAAGDVPGDGRLIWALGASVNAVAWSPDGSRLATGGDDGAVCVWDAETCGLLGMASPHFGPVRSVAWSPDGRWIASGSDDSTIRVRDAETLEVRSIAEDDQGIRSVAFSPNGELVASGGHTGVPRTWDAATGEPGSALLGHEGSILAVTFDREGSRLATGGNDSTVRIWNLRTYEPESVLVGARGEIRAVAFSPAGSHVVGGAADGTVHVWGAGGKSMQTLTGHEGDVWSVAYSPDGSRIASGGADGTVRIWDEHGKPERVFEKHQGEFWSVAFSPEGSRLAGACADGGVRIWDLREGQLHAVLAGHETRIRSVAFAAGGERLATSDEAGSVRFWDRAGGHLSTAATMKTGVESVAFSPDGTRLGVSGDTLNVVDVETGEFALSFPVGDAVGTVVFSPDGALIATGGLDTVRIWTAGGEPVHTLQGHQLAVNAVAFSPDSSRLATCGDDRAVNLWDVEKGELLHAVDHHENVVRTLAFSPDGTLIASGGDYGTIHVSAVEPPEPRHTLRGHQGGTRSVAFSPDGATIASGGNDGAVRAWSTETGQLEPAGAEHGRPVAQVAYTPDGAHIAAAGLGGVWLHDAARATREAAGPRSGPEPRTTSDRWTTDDALGYDVYAEALTAFIRNPNTKPPLAISIKGDWGAGKTSLMRMVRERLDPDADSAKAPKDGGGHRPTNREVLAQLPELPEERSVLEPGDDAPGAAGRATLTTVWFNAWIYQSGQQLWAGLADAIIRELTGRMSFAKRERFWATLHLKRVDTAALRRRIYRLVIERLLLPAGLLLLAWLGSLALWASDAAAWAPVTVLAAPTVAFAAWAARTWKKTLGESVDTAWSGLVREPDYTTEAGFLHLLHTDMERIFEAGGVSEERPLVVFVDDLDRCSYRTAAEVIEALNLFLACQFPNCIFVIGMEPHLVAAQVGVAYRELFGTIAGDETAAARVKLGWRFLEKMVQLPVALPPPQSGRLKTYVESITDYVEPAPEASPPEPVTEAAIAVQERRIEQEVKRRGGDLGDVVDAARTVAPARDGDAAAPLDRSLVIAAQRVASSLTTEHDPEVQKMIREHAALLSGNPREIKRFLNLFRFYANVQTGRSLSGFPAPSLDQVGKIAALGVRWPHLVRDLTTSSDAIAELERLARDNEKVEEWLAANGNAGLAHDAPAIHAFLREGPEIGEYAPEFL